MPETAVDRIDAAILALFAAEPRVGVLEASRRCERYFSEALPLHVEDEEQSLLPRRRGRTPELDDVPGKVYTRDIYGRD